jgi:Flp pilus assembly protein TadD
MRRFLYALIAILLLAGVVAAQESEPQTAAGCVNRGLARQRKGDFVGAIADYDRAVALNPGDASTYGHRGAARDGKRDYEGAIADFNKAIDLIPNFPAAIANRAWRNSTKEWIKRLKQIFRTRSP